jgi:type IV pilus assembly protein PilA
MRQQGMTLIEIMLVMLIMALLALAASPFTSAWVGSAHISETLSTLEQAVGRAKASALRNPAAVQGEMAASAICLTNGEIRLFNAAPGVAASCNGVNPAWRTTLPRLVQVQIGAANWMCSCFTNKSALTTSGDCNACTNNLNFTVRVGADSESLALF